VAQTGSALMSLTTLRDPDSIRGRNLHHFYLVLPGHIEALVKEWHLGNRGSLSPREAADLLWDLTPNGWIDALQLTGLVAANRALAETDQANWPKSQTELRQFVVDNSAFSGNWAGLHRVILAGNYSELLNDLVLIFKYAAVGRKRSIQLVCDLYKLVATLLAPDGPGTKDEVRIWLTGPIVVPEVFSRRSDPRGPTKPQLRWPNDSPTLPFIDQSLFETGSIRAKIEASITSAGGVVGIANAIYIPPLRRSMATIQLYGARLLVNTAELQEASRRVPTVCRPCNEELAARHPGSVSKLVIASRATRCVA
jgi:hypothetical protein